MQRDLKSRLARLRELGLVVAGELSPGQGGGTVGRQARGSAAPSFLSGWKETGPLVWERIVVFPDRLPDSLDTFPFRSLGRRAARESGATDARDGSAGEDARTESLVDARVDARELRFFDLETTGLSGGAGTVSFLAAVGRRGEEGFEVRQLFLADYPGEPLFIESLLSSLEPGCTIVTYNGAAFDLPLLRTRCVMNGMIAPERAHVDALFASRRLWRRVHGGASLGLLEREVLGVEREMDVPGSLIPEIWFAFLRDGDHPLMPGVFAHNAADVASLARLVERAASAFESPRALAASSSLDRAGLGRTLLAAGRGAEGEELLEAALADGDEDAGLLLSRRYRREGRAEDRVRVLGLLPRAFRSCVERAKYEEHSERNLRAALEWAGAALALARRGAEEEAVSQRIARIERKARRCGGCSL